MERSGAAAGCVLVPDDDEWRVAAGIGLRPLEHRLRLAGDHWLTDTVASQSKGVLIEGSDIARGRMGGAPLAARNHLMAVPIPTTGAVILLARDEGPFAKSLVSELADVAAEGRPLLLDALAARNLARGLRPLADLDDDV
jgi:hypothetical protein